MCFLCRVSHQDSWANQGNHWWKLAVTEMTQQNPPQPAPLLSLQLRFWSRYIFPEKNQMWGKKEARRLTRELSLRWFSSWRVTSTGHIRVTGLDCRRRCTQHQPLSKRCTDQRQRKKPQTNMPEKQTNKTCFTCRKYLRRTKEPICPLLVMASIL